MSNSCFNTVLNLSVYLQNFVVTKMVLVIKMFENFCSRRIIPDMILKMMNEGNAVFTHSRKQPQQAQPLMCVCYHQATPKNVHNVPAVVNIMVHILSVTPHLLMT